ncbi:MAG: DUF4259 domain-containing protein [bacterium]
MGAWGSGNFENDTAADHVLTLSRQLLGQIEATVEDGSAMEPDEYDSEVMMCNLEILACLAEHLGRYEKGSVAERLFPDVLPEASVVATWKTKYLDVWDSYIDKLRPKPEYKRQRRAVIVETFDRVTQLSSRNRG